MSRFLSTKRSILRAASLILVLSLCYATDSAFSQPPNRPSRGRGSDANAQDQQQGGRRSRGRGDARQNGGSTDAPGQNGGMPGGPGQNGGMPGAPDQNGGMPGGFGPNGGMPGGFGPNGGMPGGFGPNGGMPGGFGPNGGMPGQNAPEGDQQQKQEPKVDLDKALDSTLGTIPIRLNQDEFCTVDNVRLTGTYFKGKGDKDTPVVILIPGLNAEENAYSQVAVGLAQKGYAVLIPDLRKSSQNQGPSNNNPPNDSQQVRDRMASQPSNRDVSAMINTDREVWFNFLFHVNDKGLCNVKKTIIVGSEFSAALASAWTKNDWAVKGELGQNVVGLALLSPDAVDDKKKDKDDKEDDNRSSAQKYDCLKSLEAVHKYAKGKVFGYLIIAGENNQEKFESAQLIQHKIGGAKDEQAKPQDKVVMFYSLKTSAQGMELLSGESFNVPNTLALFVDKRMREIPKKRDRWKPINEDLSNVNEGDRKKRD